MKQEPINYDELNDNLLNQSLLLTKNHLEEDK